MMLPSATVITSSAPRSNRLRCPPSPKSVLTPSGKGKNKNRRSPADPYPKAAAARLWPARILVA